MPIETSLENVRQALSKAGYKIVSGYTAINAEALPKPQPAESDEWLLIDNPLPRLVSYAWNRNRFGITFGYFWCNPKPPLPFILKGLPYSEAFIKPACQWQSADNLELVSLAEKHKLIWHWHLEKMKQRYYLLAESDPDDKYVIITHTGITPPPHLQFELDDYLSPYQQSVLRYPVPVQGILNMLFQAARKKLL